MTVPDPIAVITTIEQAREIAPDVVILAGPATAG